VASYNPWVGLHWLVSGRTVGGTQIKPPAQCLGREAALRLYTQGSAWFSSEDGVKGSLKPGFWADFTALSDDYFAVPVDRIAGLESVLTVVGGKVVHGAGPYEPLAPEAPRPSTDWSPAGRYPRLAPSAAGGSVPGASAACCAAPCGLHAHRHLFAAVLAPPVADRSAFWGALGCSCAY
jgi:hypothetical protein